MRKILVMDRKDIAKQFLQMAGMGQVETAYEKFVHADFVHHNQYFASDRTTLQKAMADAHQESPNESINITKCITDDEQVVTYSHVVKKDMEIAVVHIFRFEGNKIIEMWDVGQIIDPDSPNELGLF